MSTKIKKDRLYDYTADLSASDSDHDINLDSISPFDSSELSLLEASDFLDWMENHHLKSGEVHVDFNGKFSID